MHATMQYECINNINILDIFYPCKLCFYVFQSTETIIKTERYLGLASVYNQISSWEDLLGWFYFWLLILFNVRLSPRLVETIIITIQKFCNLIVGKL